jgi:hypothetical protein
MHEQKVDRHAVCVCVCVCVLLLTRFGPINMLGKLNTVYNITFKW